jgi:single-stranded DNA-specific DHH superfamily exonuclease
VDCGITSFSEVEALKQAGIDVIIIDHHEPSAHGIPDAVAVVNPKRKDCAYPFKGLAAVGLVAKLNRGTSRRFTPKYRIDTQLVTTKASRPQYADPMPDKPQDAVSRSMKQVSQR